LLNGAAQSDTYACTDDTSHISGVAQLELWRCAAKCSIFHLHTISGFLPISHM